MLNIEQKAAATYMGPNKYLLVNAGAGCGKTKTIVSRVEFLCQKGIPARNILLLTFTNKAGKEMMGRLNKVLDEEIKGLFAGTFHKFCIQAMMRLPALFPMANSTLLDTDDQNALMNIIRGKFVDTKNKEFNKAVPKAPVIVSLYSYARNSQVDLASYLEQNHSISPEVLPVVSEITKAYQDYKETNGYYDYDDMLEVFCKTVEQNRELHSRLANAYHTVLVDEFQDTNPLQMRFLKLFTSGPTNFFCVGDPAQSIYAFRGADFEHMMEFQSYFPSASEILPLATNYRSSQEILDLSNWLLNQSDLDYPNHLVSSSGASGIKPKVVDLYSSQDEGNYICKTIKHHVAEGDVELDNVKVIVRTAWSARGIEASMIEHNIPYRFIGGTALMKSAHIKDVLSLLYSAMDSNNEIAWSRYLTLWPRVGSAKANKMIVKLLEAGDMQAEFEVQQEFGEHHGLVNAYQAVREEIENPKQALMNAVVHMEAVMDAKYDNWEVRKEDFNLLYEICEKYKTVREFLNAFSLEPVSQTELENKDAKKVVTLITAHSAKGSEAKLCFAASAIVGNYPHQRTYGDKKQEEEERRVLYVALTRAEQFLYITRYGYSGGGSFAALSPYHLSLIPDHLVDKENLCW